MMDVAMTEAERRRTATEAAARKMHDVWVGQGRQYRDPTTRKWRKGPDQCLPTCRWCFR